MLAHSHASILNVRIDIMLDQREMARANVCDCHLCAE